MSITNGNVETSGRRNGADSPKIMRRKEVARVVNQIDALCDAFGVGARIPAHRDLMTRFATTERTVLHALSELQRRGRIVRRAGSGTYVAAVEGVSPSHSDILPEATSNSNYVSGIVVVGSLDQGFYSRAIEMAFRLAQEAELEVTFEPPNFERLATIARSRGNGQLGFLVIGSKNVHDALQIYDGRQRIVGVGDRKLADRIPFSCVYPDNLTGGYMAASHLIELGHRRIAYLGAGENPRLWGHEQAVRQAREAGHDVRSVTILRSIFNDWQQTPSLGEAFFADPEHPTAICTWNDTDAISLITFLMSIGFNVPSDISIVGYDNIPAAQTITPALTTIDTHLDDQVKLAISQLINQRNLPHHSIVVDPELTARASTTPR